MVLGCENCLTSKLEVRNNDGNEEMGFKLRIAV